MTWPVGSMLTASERRTIQHEPDGACGADDHCWYHHIDEPLEQSDYRVCGECLHVFRTARELRRAWRRQVWGDRRVMRPWALMRVMLRPARRIWFCPHCSHDF